MLIFINKECRQRERSPGSFKWSLSLLKPGVFVKYCKVKPAFIVKQLFGLGPSYHKINRLTTIHRLDGDMGMVILKYPEYLIGKALPYHFNFIEIQGNNFKFNVGIYRHIFNQ